MVELVGQDAADDPFAAAVGPGLDNAGHQGALVILRRALQLNGQQGVRLETPLQQQADAVGRNVMHLCRPGVVAHGGDGLAGNLQRRPRTG
jgi:hypothetical protein